MSLLPVIKDYLNNICSIRDFSPASVKDYTRCLDEFQQFVGEISPSQLSISHIQNFKMTLQSRGVGLRTQAYYLIIIRQLLRHCFNSNIQTIDYRKIELNKWKAKTPVYLELDELHALFNAVDTSSNRGLRDMAVIQILYCTGMRVGELARLNFFDLDLKNGDFVFTGKGRKERTAFLSPVAMHWIKLYLETRKDDCNALFINYRNARKTTERGEKRRLSITAIQSIVRTYAKIAKINKRITPHSLRHTCATHLYQQSGDIKAVQDLLGHEWITTTQIYTHTSKKYLKAFHQKFLPFFAT